MVLELAKKVGSGFSIFTLHSVSKFLTVQLMMRRIALILFLSVSSLWATDVFLEGKAAYFLPTSGDFKRIYGGSGLYGIEMTVQAWRELHVWTSVDFFTKRGHSSSGYNTKVFFIPIGFGLKYLKLFSIDASRSWGIYGGIGGLGVYLHTKDVSPYVVKRLHQWGGGGIAKTGVMLIKDLFLIDLFVNYSFSIFGGHRSSDPLIYSNDTTICGWSFGGALGRQF